MKRAKCLMMAALALTLPAFAAAASSNSFGVKRKTRPFDRRNL